MTTKPRFIAMRNVQVPIRADGYVSVPLRLTSAPSVPLRFPSVSTPTPEAR